VLIVGGVAGGASCAARLRRLDESVEIMVWDRGPYVAFANCGLPYYVGNVIADERTLLVASPEMLAENVLNGDMPVADWLALDRTEALLVDVREPDEFAGGHIPNAINLPLSQLRDRYAELPTHREIWTCYGVGQRAYFATRFLMQHGYQSQNLSGGYATYQAFRAVGRNPHKV